MSPEYQATLDYLFSRLPVFQHIGKAAYKADLNNTIALAEAIGNPEKSFTSIHIAGTNGKGSVSSILASIFSCHGFKTGLYTSPHLKDFRERIRIDGEMISEDEVTVFTEKVKPLIESINPSFFEITVAMAFDHFRKNEVDIAIIETGMGGRLDSTNIITPELSIITNIGMDHMEFLGDTLSKIAVEKAGIIKPGIPVVVGETTAETLLVFETACKERNSKLYLASGCPENWVECLPLKGDYQRKNLATVSQCLHVLENLGTIKTDALTVEKALREVVQWTGLRGRWEVIGNEPLIVADTAHNEHGLAPAMAQLSSLKKAQIHFVIGAVNDKDLEKIFPLLPKQATYYFCKPNVIRGLDAHVLASKAEKAGILGSVYSSVTDAVLAAKKAATKDDVIYIGGSTFVVAEALPDIPYKEE